MLAMHMLKSNITLKTMDSMHIFESFQDGAYAIAVLV